VIVISVERRSVASSTDELVRVAAESNIKPRRLPPGGSNDPSG
jgi:hypothetical protein